MYAVLQSYTFDPVASAEINRHINDGWLPLLRRMPGFVACYWLDSGAGACVALCIFEDEASAQSALAQASGCAALQQAALNGPLQVVLGAVTAYTNAGL